jgi:hypothetical protein
MGVVGFQQSSQAAYEAETRRRFEKTINGLLGVMNVVKDLEGRKSLLFVSGGIPALSFIRFFEGGTVGDATAVQSQIAAAKVQDPFKILGKKGFRTGSEIFDDLVRFANSHNISFYALDPDNYLRYMLGDIAYRQLSPGGREEHRRGGRHQAPRRDRGDQEGRTGQPPGLGRRHRRCRFSGRRQIRRFRRRHRTRFLPLLRAELRTEAEKGRRQVP